MATSEMVLALLGAGPAHGYDVKRRHDEWYADTKPLPFGQVYATLARLQRDGLAEVVGTGSAGGPERTAYGLTAAGEGRLDAWLAEPAAPAHSGADDIVRKTVACLRVGRDPSRFLADQRAAHLRRMRELSGAPHPEPASRLVRDHLLAHLDADLRWLDLAVERTTAGTTQPPILRVGKPSNATRETSR